MARPDAVVNVEEMLGRVGEYWAPKNVAEVNGLELKVVKAKGDFVWHNHPEGDELFFVVSGEMTIELAGRESVRLGPGDMFVVPRGLDHRPVTEEECRVLLLDPAGVVNTGGTESDLTARPEWI